MGSRRYYNVVTPGFTSRVLADGYQPQVAIGYGTRGAADRSSTRARALYRIVVSWKEAARG